MQQTLISIQKILVQNRKNIERSFLLVELILVLGLVGLGFALSKQMVSIAEAYDLGKSFGVLALGWYSLSLLPGIMQRLRFQPLVAAMLTLFRRHFGILMFLSALIHYFGTTLIFVFFTDTLPQLSLAQTFGWFAFLLAMPLWVTSNNMLEHKLGKWWKRIHRLTYVILLLVFGHLVFTMTNWAWLAGVVLLLELTSWAVAWRRARLVRPRV